MTRRAFLSSKSNTAAWEIWFKWACQNPWQLGRESEDFSGSVNSFDFGPIFLPRPGQDLSRNVFVVSIYAFERISYWWIGFCMTPRMTKNHEFSDCIRENRIFPHFGGPAEGSAPGKVLRPKDTFHMTRRAFLSLTVLIIYNSVEEIFLSNNRPPFCRAIKFTFFIFSRRSRLFHKNQWILTILNFTKKITSNSTCILVRFCSF